MASELMTENLARRRIVQLAASPELSPELRETVRTLAYGALFSDAPEPFLTIWTTLVEDEATA